MIDKIDIYNILGSKNVNNETPIIKIRYKHINKYLIKNCLIDNYVIYYLDYEKFCNDMSKYIKNIDLNNFITFGTYCYKKKSNIEFIFLCNKFVVPNSKKFIKIFDFNDYSIWIAILTKKNKKCRSLGLNITKKNIIPDYYVPVFPYSYIIKMDFNDNLVTNNNLNLLNFKIDGLWNINKLNFNLNFDSLKIKGINNKIYKNLNSSQISYNSQGNIKMNNLCLTDNKNLELNKCNNNNNQKWLPYNGNFISMNNNLLNNLSDYYENNNNKNLKNIKQKDLKLVSKKNPWYLNNNIVNSNTLNNIINNKIISPFKYNNNFNIKINENFKNDIKENFNNNNVENNDQSYVVFFLFILLISIILIRYNIIKNLI